MRLFYLIPLFFLYCFMAAGLLAITTVSNLTTDQSALLSFKAHVDDPWGVLTNNWSISYPVCSWVGISCGIRHQRVTALNLSSMALTGTIPPYLGNLSFLVYLNMRRNNFHGHLPNELGQLRRLRRISFAYNKLIGSFSWIGVLSKLQLLSLHSNNLTGPIPNSLFNSSSMEKLDVSLNLLDGNIPSRIGNFSTLVFLNLGWNNLQGEIPEEIGNLQNLKILELDYNNISGPIPPTMFNISTITDIYLAFNQLSGEIPEEIGNLQNLKILELDYNNISGPIPPTMFNISTITDIYLGSNQLSGNLPLTIGHTLPVIESLSLSLNKLTGSIPTSITNASKLSLLEVNTNFFSGLIPNTFGNLRFLSFLNIADNYLTTESGWSFLSSLTNCRNLSSLAIGSNPLRGILPPLIGNFSASLQYIFASGCKLNGNIPREIGNLRGLIVLSLFNNDLNGTIPTAVERLQQLQGLGLSFNNLQGSIPNDLCRMEMLNGLGLRGNKLSGHIPQCLANLTSLRHLYLGSNKLTSSIPSSFWSLEYILKVDLSSNSLSGSLPSNVQNLKVLIYLNLSSNQLSGNIPMTIGVLKDLVTLSLAGNQFQGPIPESFGNLISLKSLDLSTNNLSGEIPKSLEALSYLKQLNVSHNKLEGKIPTNGPFKNISAQSFIGNYALCGSPRLQVPSCKEDNNTGSKKAAISVLKYVLPIIVCTLLIAIVIIFFIRSRNKSTRIPDREDSSSLVTWRRISYPDIQRATDGFNECNLLGTGSFGSVYKGTLYDGTNVAIKVFNLQLERAFKSFEVECEVLRNIRHRNLVKILNSCSSIDFKALVLEFMPNGSLEKWLYSHNYFLDIQERLNIMIDVGLALEYLHHGHSLHVVHCDLKPSNILLDENMVAHVSDFGISKLLGEQDDHVTQTMTMATIGYMAPEYGSEGIISSKCDVYSYGVLLMETFTRKKPTDEMFSGEMGLKKWINDSIPHGLIKVIDANLLQGEQAFTAEIDCLLSIMHLALDCCTESPDQRMDMADVVPKLKKIKVKFLDVVPVTK